MSRNTQVNHEIIDGRVKQMLKSNKDYRVIFGDFMVPSPVGGYTDNDYQVDEFLMDVLENYLNNRRNYLEALSRIITGEVKLIRIITQEENINVETLIDPEQVVDEVESIKVGNGFLEDGQFKSETDKLFIHRITTPYIHQLESHHQAVLDQWLDLLDWMTHGDEGEQKRLQLFMSSIFLVKNHERKAFSQFGLFGGASGSGKSSLFSIVGKAIGEDKSVNLKLGEFTDDNKLQESRGKLLIIDNELDNPIRGGASSKLKQAAEGGEFIINSKYVEAYPMTMSGTIVLATNKDYDTIVPYQERNGLNRRIQTFWFERPLSLQQQRTVGDFLGQDNPIVNEVILNWLVKGYIELCRHQFDLSHQQSDKELFIGSNADEVTFPGSDTWKTFSMDHALLKRRVRREGERVYVIEKDPRGHFTNYITYSEIKGKTYDEVMDLLELRGWELKLRGFDKEGKIITNQRILHHFNLEPREKRRGSGKVRVYLEPPIQTSSKEKESLSKEEERLRQKIADLYTKKEEPNGFKLNF